MEVAKRTKRACPFPSGPTVNCTELSCLTPADRVPSAARRASFPASAPRRVRHCPTYSPRRVGLGQPWRLRNLPPSLDRCCYLSLTPRSSSFPPSSQRFVYPALLAHLRRSIMPTRSLHLSMSRRSVEAVAEDVDLRRRERFEHFDLARSLCRSSGLSFGLATYCALPAQTARDPRLGCGTRYLASV